MTLPKDAAARKAAPVFSGVLRYFPDALVAVAELSKIGNDQHNPGQPLHWDKSKSSDEGDALVRHLIEAGTRDEDGVRHSAKVAWRALALLQREIEAEQEAQLKQQSELTPEQAQKIASLKQALKQEAEDKQAAKELAASRSQIRNDLDELKSFAGPDSFASRARIRREVDPAGVDEGPDSFGGEDFPSTHPHELDKP